MREALRFLPRQAHARPLAYFSVAFLLGLLVAQSRPAPAWICAVGLAAVVCVGILLRRRRRAWAIILLFAGLLAGMTRMNLAVSAAHLEDTRYSVVMTGRVASEPYKNPSTGRLVFRFALESEDEAASRLTLRLYLRGEDEALDAVAYGQRLRLTGHIWKPDPVTNSHEFDFGAYLVRQGFDGYATARIEDVEILETTRDVRSAIIALRQAVARRIDALFPNNAAMMRALLLGDRSQLGDELREALNRSGTAHLISISGLHVTVLAVLLSFLLRRFMPRKWANLLSVGLLIPYGVMIGFSAPFTRALSVFALLCFATIAGRPSDSITRLCAVMLAYLIARPLSIGDAGFVLSYSASAGIILLMPPLQRLTGIEALRKRKPSPMRLHRVARRLALYFPTLLCASLAAQLATLPSVIAFFGVQSVVSLPFNLICVPLCMLGYITGIVALLTSVVWLPLSLFIAKVPDALFTLLSAITRMSALIPLSSVRIGRYPAVLVLIHWAIMLASSDLSKLRPDMRRFMPFTLMLVAGLSSLLIFAGAWNYSIVFLDAGQADCAVVRTRGHTYMFDIGDTYTPAADYLNATCLHLDGIVLSHPHQDHAGGLKSVLMSFKPDAVYVPKGWFEVEDVSPAVTEGIDLAKSMGVEIRELSAGDEIQLSATARLEVYAPNGAAPLPAEVNDMSLLTLVTCEGHSALFTGDLSMDAEPEIIPDTDVLKVAHHGSARASSERFLDACTPEIAVICVGENNYGHPTQETLDKLAAVGAQIYTTRDSGTVTLTCRGGVWHIKTYLEEARHELE